MALLYGGAIRHSSPTSEHERVAARPTASDVIHGHDPQLECAVKEAHRLMKLRADTTEEPVAERRQLAKQDRRAWLAASIRLWKRRERDIAFGHNRSTIGGIVARCVVTRGASSVNRFAIADSAFAPAKGGAPASISYSTHPNE